MNEYSMKNAIIVIGWVICSVLSYGVCFNDLSSISLRNSTPGLFTLDEIDADERNDAFGNRIISFSIAILGPLGILVSFIISFGIERRVKLKLKYRLFSKEYKISQVLRKLDR